MNVKTLINNFKSGSYDGILLDYYVDESLLNYQRKRYVNLLNEYLDKFGDDEVVVLSVPGRSEITGNHTDQGCQNGSLFQWSVHQQHFC